MNWFIVDMDVQRVKISYGNLMLYNHLFVNYIGYRKLFLRLLIRFRFPSLMKYLVNILKNASNKWLLIWSKHVEKGNKKFHLNSKYINSKSHRVWRHFEAWMKKGGLISGTNSDYLLPSECCVMVNVLLDCKVQVNNYSIVYSIIFYSF